MRAERKKRNIALLVLGSGITMFVLMLIFVLPYFMSEKKFGEMQAALNDGDYAQVITIAQFLLDQNPASVQAYYFRAQASVAQKKYYAAERDLEKVIKLNAQYSNMRSVSVQLGEIYHKHGLALLNSRPDVAYRLLAKAIVFLPREISLKKDSASASYFLGQALEGKNRDRAINFYREALKNNADNALYKVALGRNLLEVENPEEGIPLMTDAFENDETLKTPGNIKILKQALWLQATIKERDYYFGKFSDVNEVTSLFNAILKLDENNADVLLEQFALAINTENIVEAEKTLKDIIAKGLLVRVEDLNILLNTVGNVHPQTIISNGSELAAEVKLDSEIAWSSDGKRIFVKAVDKSTSEAKVVEFKLNGAFNTVLKSEDKLDWEGKIFAPNADGILVASGSNLYRVNDLVTGLEKITKIKGAILDIAREGDSALVTNGQRINIYKFDTHKRTSISISGLRGDIIEALYSPGNKRIAAVAGDEEHQKIGAYLGKGRSKMLAEGNVSNLKWSWDGKNIYYLNSQNGINAIFGVAADGKSQPQPFTKPELNPVVFEPSPVDDYLLYKDSVGKETLWLDDEKDNLKAITPRYGDIGKFVWSPDGTKVAYFYSPVKDGPVRLELVDISRQ